MKTQFEFDHSVQELVAKYFPDWEERLKNAARNELLEMASEAFKKEKIFG